MGDMPTGEVTRLTGGTSGDTRITERMQPAATSDTTPVLKRGKFNSDAVRALQIGLQDVAAYADDSSLDPGAIDSDFGKNTENAVKAFQKRMGLAVTGVADQDTLDRLYMARGAMRYDEPIDRYAVVGPGRNLAEMKTGGYRMTPAQELRLTRQAKAPHATNIFDFAEDIREAGATSFVPDEPFDNLYKGPKDSPPPARPRRLSREDRLGETDLFPAPSDDRLKTSDTGLRGMSMADMRKLPLIEQLLSMPKEDRAALANLLNEDTGR
jgi:peptidoglycan hydrolase-like protein with peptidoglycan-binding domain